MDAGAMNLSLSQRVVPADSVLFQEVGGESVLLNLATESYYGLDEVGTRVWFLLRESAALQQVLDTMLGEFEVEKGRLESDILELVTKLAAAGLVSIE
jgi:hypothetical protein